MCQMCQGPLSMLSPSPILFQLPSCSNYLTAPTTLLLQPPLVHPSDVTTEATVSTPYRSCPKRPHYAVSVMQCISISKAVSNCPRNYPSTVPYKLIMLLM